MGAVAIDGNNCRELPPLRARTVSAEQIDREIANRAKPQRGHITRKQLRQIGLSIAEIDYRVKIGRLIPVYCGVYAVGCLPSLPIERAVGAVLACGPGAVLSHGSAGSVWGIYKYWDMPFEVSVPQDRRPGKIRVHRHVRLARQDWRIDHGMRLTTPARTLLDLAPRLAEPDRIAYAIDGMRLHQYMKIEQLAEVVIRAPRHPGAKLLRPHLESPTGITRSMLEVTFKSWIVTYGLPMPQINPAENGNTVDAYFEVERVIVEVDGWDTHRTKRAFEADRERDAANLDTDIITVRLTHERMTASPEREARRLGRILARRRDQRAR
jgi:hypothetical protein